MPQDYFKRYPHRTQFIGLTQERDNPAGWMTQTTASQGKGSLSLDLTLLTEPSEGILSNI